MAKPRRNHLKVQRKAFVLLQVVYDLLRTELLIDQSLDLAFDVLSDLNGMVLWVFLRRMSGNLLPEQHDNLAKQ